MSDQNETNEVVRPINLSADLNAPYRQGEKLVRSLERMWSRSEDAQANALVVEAVIYLTGGESSRFGVLPESEENALVYSDGRANEKFGHSQTPDGRVIGTWSNALAALCAYLATGQKIGVTRETAKWVVACAGYYHAGGTGKFQR